MANVIEKEVEASVERQAQLTPSYCNWGWGNCAEKWSLGGDVVEHLKGGL